MTYVVYCQETTVYESGELDYNNYEYDRFTDYSEACSCVDRLNNNPYRDIHEYFFVRCLDERTN